MIGLGSDKNQTGKICCWLEIVTLLQGAQDNAINLTSVITWHWNDINVMDKEDIERNNGWTLCHCTDVTNYNWNGDTNNECHAMQWYRGSEWDDNINIILNIHPQKSKYPKVITLSLSVWGSTASSPTIKLRLQILKLHFSAILKLERGGLPTLPRP